MCVFDMKLSMFCYVVVTSGHWKIHVNPVPAIVYYPDIKIHTSFISRMFYNLSKLMNRKKENRKPLTSMWLEPFGPYVYCFAVVFVPTDHGRTRVLSIVLVFVVVVLCFGCLEIIFTFLPSNFFLTNFVAVSYLRVLGTFKLL